MFYHVRIDYCDKKLKVNQTLYEYDYSTQEEVIENIVAPYVEEKRFLFSGVFLNAEERIRLSVYETEFEIKRMVMVANQNVSPHVVFVYNNELLLNTSKYAKDITKEMTQCAISSVEDKKRLRWHRQKRKRLNNHCCL